MQDSLQVDQAFFKAPSINCNIIHVDLHNALHQITEDAKHASLECGRGITQAEGILLYAYVPNGQVKVVLF